MRAKKIRHPSQAQRRITLTNSQGVQVICGYRILIRATLKLINWSSIMGIQNCLHECRASVKSSLFHVPPPSCCYRQRRVKETSLKQLKKLKQQDRNKLLVKRKNHIITSRISLQLTLELGQQNIDDDPRRCNEIRIPTTSTSSYDWRDFPLHFQHHGSNEDSTESKNNSIITFSAEEPQQESNVKDRTNAKKSFMRQSISWPRSRAQSLSIPCQSRTSDASPACRE